MHVCEAIHDTLEVTGTFLVYRREGVCEISPSFVMLLVNMGCRRQGWKTTFGKVLQKRGAVSNLTLHGTKNPFDYWPDVPWGQLIKSWMLPGGEQPILLLLFPFTVDKALFFFFCGFSATPKKDILRVQGNYGVDSPEKLRSRSPCQDYQGNWKGESQAPSPFQQQRAINFPQPCLVEQQPTINLCSALTAAAERF